MSWPATARLGKKHTAESIAKMRASHRKVWQNPVHRANYMPTRSSNRLGSKHTLETRRRIAASHTGMKLSKSTKRKISIAINNKRRYTSNLERRAKLLMKQFGLHSKIWLADHTYDYGSRRKKVLVEINGCYWHNHGCGLPMSGLKPRDKYIARLAKKLGYQLIVLWECEEDKWGKQMRLSLKVA